MTTITSSTCERCGAKVDPGARFCMSCGSKVPTALVSALPASAIPQTPQQLLESLREATLGEYEILAQLGQGGMATVFLGHDIHLDRKVAIKVMSPALLSGEGMIERFKLEARTAAKLSHPHIIPIFAVRELGSLLYFVMKFVEGRPLDSIIHEVGPLPIPMVQTILARVADALGYAHRNGVVHRDIKPANIMIDVEGLPVVTDFGIAKVAEKQGLTMTGATIGTPTYMSPEQCMSQEITGASDQYSLGIVANEMLTGKPPFDADSMMTIMYKHCHEAPPPVTRARVDCPFQLQDAVLRMLEKNPQDRWPSMEEVSSIFDPGALAFDDPSRTQLVSLAKNGSNTRLLQSISTPRSQTPVSGPAGKRSRAGQKTAQDDRVSTGAKTIRVSAPSASAAAKARKKKLGLSMVVGGLGAVAGVVAVLMWSPWRASGDTNQGSHPSPGAPGPTAVVARLEGLPSSLSVVVNTTQPLAPQAQDSAGAAMASAVFTFSSDQPAVVEVSPQGIVRGLRAGTATVTVSSGAALASIPVTVTAPTVATPTGPTAPRGATVASIQIQGPSAPIEVGQRVPLQASARDAGGRTLPSERVSWTSSNQGIATVNETTGEVVGAGPGTARITASAGGKTEVIPITVQPEAVGRVQISPSRPDTLLVGTSTNLNASVFATNGRELSGRSITWSSSNQSVARVSGGTVQALASGTTTIKAESEGRDTAVEITVTRAAANTPTTATSALSPREAVEAVIQEYGRALEKKNFDAIRQLFPDIPTGQLNLLRDFVEPLRSLTVTMTVRNIDVGGETATASVHQVIQLVERNGRPNTVPGDPTIRLRRIDGVWRIVELK